jgi:hypothetical protein
MSETSLAVLAREIERRAHKLSGVLLREESGELDRLRDEAALLQSAIAQATRLQRLMLGGVGPGAALLTPVVIETSGFAGFGLVRNLTDLGMSARVFSCLTSGMPARIHFSTHDRIDGTIVAATYERIEIAFDRPLAVAQMLSSPAADGKPKRPARLMVRGEIELVAGRTRPLSADVVDVSQHGLKVFTAPLRTGQLVNVDVGGFDLRPAMVRWSRAGATGLRFAQPLSHDELRLWNP